MRRITAILLLAVLVSVTMPAAAQQAEAKEAARSANCAPGKLEVLKQVTGRVGETIYKVSCTGQKDAFVVIQCRDRTCTVLR
ncbi:hypothetical protein [Niveispirillum fermenti]|uniref:hypothetical protein n=1 Tax=Niveispirillum fermenti TaxID=1233113 RepID=UPI003A851795